MLSVLVSSLYFVRMLAMTIRAGYSDRIYVLLSWIAQNRTTETLNWRLPAFITLFRSCFCFCRSAYWGCGVGLLFSLVVCLLIVGSFVNFAVVGIGGVVAFFLVVDFFSFPLFRACFTDLTNRFRKDEGDE